MAVKIVTTQNTDAWPYAMRRPFWYEYRLLLRIKMDGKKVEIVGCPRTLAISAALQPEDWKTEYFDYKLSLNRIGLDRSC